MTDTGKILVIGANGQLGVELTEALIHEYGEDRVIPSDITSSDQKNFIVLDMLNADQLRDVVQRHNVQTVYLLAALLSAKGEQNPLLAWRINMDGLLNVLELAREGLVQQLFWPSSIAVFGASTPKVDTPQETIIAPDTMYGITKLAGERLCAYYAKKFDVDVRSLRYPGLIGHRALPGGGTTDYAVDIYHKAVAGESFGCFLSADTRLPFMYMPDAVRATLEIMQASASTITVRSSYNLAGFSGTPAEIAASIQQHVPDFRIEYQPDFRQQIADGWPESIDDQQARQDWGWKARVNLAEMTEDMLAHLETKHTSIVRE
ncbi:MAG: NAD-dependent epimerase/dehydratase family protein [Cyclobacteriaceae bacterium]